MARSASLRAAWRCSYSCFSSLPLLPMVSNCPCSLARRYGLSGREEEIAGFVIAGELNSAIAERLFISVYTVKNHIHSIFGKTGAKNRIDLMRIGNEAIKTTT